MTEGLCHWFHIWYLEDSWSKENEFYLAAHLIVRLLSEIFENIGFSKLPVPLSSSICSQVAYLLQYLCAHIFSQIAQSISKDIQRSLPFRHGGLITLDFVFCLVSLLFKYSILSNTVPIHYFFTKCIRVTVALRFALSCHVGVTESVRMNWPRLKQRL